MGGGTLELASHPGILGPRGDHAGGSPLGQPLEPLEGVVDEDPVLVPVADLVGLVLAVVAVVHVVVVHAGDLEVDLLKVNKKNNKQIERVNIKQNVVPLGSRQSWRCRRWS